MSLTNEEIREFTLMALDQPRSFKMPKVDFTQTGTWWVDYRGWIYDRNGSKLRVRDGLTGEVLDESEPCLGRNASAAIKVYDNVLGYCAIRETSEDSHQTWRFRFYDGSVTEIKLPFAAVSQGIYFTTYYEPFWGYANGILAISHGGQNGQSVWTYTKEGEQLFKTVAVGGVRWASIGSVYPLSWNKVGVIKSGSDFHENYYWDSYSILSDTIEHPDENKPLFARYYPTFPSGVYKNKQVTALGEDDIYFYATAKMYDSSGAETGEWVIARFNKFNYSGPEELSRYTGARTWKNVTQSKMISYQYKTNNQEYWRRFINLPTCSKYYGGRFDFFTSSSTYNGACDNATHIWIDQSGVFRK